MASTTSSDDVLARFSSFASSYDKAVGQVTGQIAQHLVAISPPFTSTSKILDNASGTGIVLEKLQDHLAESNLKIPVTAADAAEPMINFLRAKAAHEPRLFPNLDPISIHVALAENLDASIVSDDSITHSYTNFGLFFCADAHKAAQHIHRSLAPGGTAFVTSWHDFGYMDAINKTEGKDIVLPFSVEWKDPAYNKKVLVGAGFEEGKVEMKNQECFFRAKSARDMAETMFELVLRMAKKVGGEEEQSKEDWLDRMAKNLAEADSCLQNDENGFVCRMVANVAICTK